MGLKGLPTERRLSLVQGLVRFVMGACGAVILRITSYNVCYTKLLREFLGGVDDHLRHRTDRLETQEEIGERLLFRRGRAELAQRERHRLGAHRLDHP